MDFAEYVLVTLIDYGLKHNFSSITMEYVIDVLLTFTFTYLGLIYFLTSKPGYKILKKLYKYY